MPGNCLGWVVLWLMMCCSIILCFVQLSCRLRDDYKLYTITISWYPDIILISHYPVMIHHQHLPTLHLEWQLETDPTANNVYPSPPVLPLQTIKRKSFPFITNTDTDWKMRWPDLSNHSSFLSSRSQRFRQKPISHVQLNLSDPTQHQTAGMIIALSHHLIYLLCTM